MLKLDTVLCISLWNVDGALHRPKGMTLNSYNPSKVINAVLATDSS